MRLNSLLRRKGTYLVVPHDLTCLLVISSMVGVSVVLRCAGVTPKQLYKRLLRDCEKLPKEAQKHYKHSVKQSFMQHVDEPDPERVKQIISKAILDSEWVLNKYSGKKV